MSPNTNRKRIVIAEDDESILELVTVRLELAGYHTVAARDGYQALERIRSTSPTAMILDLGMPNLDGIGVLQELSRRKSPLPVLVLTARRSAEDVQRVIGLGASSYLTKPFDEKQLLQRVARLIEPPRRMEEFVMI
jgi:DNA-binding response OmpR family regulator